MAQTSIHLSFLLPLFLLALDFSFSLALDFVSSSKRQENLLCLESQVKEYSLVSAS
jgi:hypothetical protein